MFSRNSDSDRDGSSRPFIVGIGASAGGLEALEIFFEHVPLDSGIVYVVVQHLAADHPNMLGHLISQRTRLLVRDALHGTRIRADHVYVIQSGKILTIENNTLRTANAMPHQHYQIDAFFHSLARDQGERAIGVLLSGNGTDGTEGLRAIKTHGGRTLVQPPDTAKYAAMPTSAIRADVADVVLRVEKMPSYLVEYTGRVSIAPKIDESTRVDEPIPDERLLRSLDQICSILRRTTGRDFAQYKRGTLTRRLRHRLQRRRVRSLEEYMDLLERDVREPEQLSKELLVGVTHFFRDLDAFEYLERFVVPQVFASAVNQECVRIWVPGCASGEEAYSIGILMRERLTTMRFGPPVQIFATDIDPDAIVEARLGRYPEAIAEHVSEERLARFFTREKSAYYVTKEIREMCVFSEHSLIRDPPFLSLDLISCRNVLIYLESELQKKLVPVFHYALRQGGYLFLGPSEGLAGHSELFHTVDKRLRLFQRTEAISRPIIEWPVIPRHSPRAAKLASHEPVLSMPQELTINSAFERLLLQEYVPPSAVVKENGDIVCIAGLTGPYFQPPAGLLTTNLLEIAHASLRIELRTALHAAARTGAKVVRDNIVVDIDGTLGTFRLTVRSLPRFENDGFFVIVLQQRQATLDHGETTSTTIAQESAIEQLESELRSSRASLRSTIEELESANEELKSSNEELLSTNEEMQSSNEELQSSQEELKSVNEELATVNTELGRRIEELGRANADLQTLFASTDVATLFLDREHRVTKFTPAARTLFRLIDADSGRPLADLAPRFYDCDLSADVSKVLTTLQALERQVETIDRRAWYLLRIMPYRTLGHEVLGTVVTLIDITQSKHLEAERERLVDELRIADDQLRADLDATTRLFKIGSLFLRGGNLSLVLDDILDAAISVTDADYGNIQLLDRGTGDLRIMAHHGLPRDWIEYWNRVAVGQGTCGTALALGSRIIVEDVETSPIFAGTPSLEVQLQAGIRAVQSTPLIGRSGSFIGMISTHYKIRKRPSDRALRQLDLIARQTADILERAFAEEIIRESEHRFRVLVDATMDASFRMSPDWAEMRQLSGRGFLEDTTTPDSNWLARYIPAEEQARVLESINEALRTKTLFQLEHGIVRVDGSFGWAFTRTAPLFDDRGEIVEWFGLMRETTERKDREIQLREANARLREADQ